MSLSGVKRTWPIAVQMSAYDPKRNLVAAPAVAAPATTSAIWRSVAPVPRAHRRRNHDELSGRILRSLSLFRNVFSVADFLGEC
jgi:hypothetical protein